MTIASERKTSVRKKVSALTTAVSFASALIVGLITLSSLFILRDNINNVGRQLGDTATEDRMNTLEKFVSDRMEVLAINRAAMTDAFFLIEQRTVETIAAKATEILQNPGSYRANPVPPPDPGKAGVDLAAINRESALLGNIQDLLFDIDLSFNGQSVFVASELGYVITVDNASELKPEFMDVRLRSGYISARENNAAF